MKVLQSETLTRWHPRVLILSRIVFWIALLTYIYLMTQLVLTALSR